MYDDVAGIPSLVVGLLMLSHPPSLSSLPALNLKHEGEDETEVLRAVRERNCSKLRAIVADVVDSGRVSELLGDQSVRSGDHSTDVIWLATSFAISAIAGMTLTVIPYDALGQDLAQGPATRAALFGAKAFLQFAAMIAAILMTLILSVSFPSSIYRQVDILSRTGVTFVSVFGLILLASVKDVAVAVSGQKKQLQHEDGIVGLVRSLVTNRPFLQYLIIRVMVAMAFHLPPSLLVAYMKYTLFMENSVKASAVMQLSFLPLVATYLSMCNKWLRRLPARHVWFGANCVFVAAHALVSFLPHDMIRKYHLLNFAFPLYYPLLTASSLVVPNLLLAEILDYDRLRLGRGRQAMFVMFDHLIIQALDVLVSSLPSLILASMGFVNNGGCSCGCGVACALPYLRWDCPGDVGFACSSALESTNFPFYGNPNRLPPCLSQSPRVIWGFDAMLFYVPVSCCFVAAVVLSNYLIDDNQVHEIKSNLMRREAGLIAYDPIRNEIIQMEQVATRILGDDELRLVHTSEGIEPLAPLVRKLKWDAIFGLLLMLCIATTLMGLMREPGLGAVMITISLFRTLWAMMKLDAVHHRQAELHECLTARKQQHCNIFVPYTMVKSKLECWMRRARSRKHIVISRKRHSVS